MEVAKDIINKLRFNGHDAIIVGGFIRDKILNFKSYDIDIATSASVTEVQDIFPTCVPGVGANFIVNIVNGYEVATFRKDIYNSLNEVSVEPVKTFKEDSGRRDLTINSMGFDPMIDKIIDHNGGQEDIENELIRFVGIAQERIEEDPVRMLRACRFSARFEFRLVPSAFFAIKDNAHMIDNVQPERIRMEIMKAMECHRPSIFWELLQRTGLLKRIIPELDDCWFHDGGKYHSEYVHEHLMACGDYITKRDPILRLAGYLHDIGKVEAYDEYDFSFLQHEKMGTDLARDILLRLRFPTVEINRICTAILYHMSNCGEGVSSKAIRKIMVKFAKNNCDHSDYIGLRIADNVANKRKENYTGQEINDIIMQFETAYDNAKPAFSVKDIEINGRDVINAGIPSGPGVGKVLNYYFDYVLDNPELNDRTHLLDLLHRVDGWDELKIGKNHIIL